MHTPSTDWRERVGENEAAHFEALAARLGALQQRRRRGPGAPARALHAKANAAARATLTVRDGLPAHARVGIFAAPGTYDALVRYSNGGGARRKDRAPDVRGVGIKVLGVGGEKLIAALAAATTQDFLLIQSRTNPFLTPEEFVTVVEAGEREALLPLTLCLRLGPRRAFALLRALLAGLSRPVCSLATSAYFSAAPLRWGAHAARVSLEPEARDEPGARPGAGVDYLGDELTARLAAGPVRYTLRAQFYVSEERTPIEDPTRDWSDEAAPWVPLATLELPAQRLASEQGKRLAAWVDTLVFDPWHAPVEFRPLGAVMRARNAAYRVSSGARGGAGEPDAAALAAVLDGR